MLDNNYLNQDLRKNSRAQTLGSFPYSTEKTMDRTAKVNITPSLVKDMTALTQ